jgi:MFS family permease
MIEYSNRRGRGKLITLVFSTQALGLIVGPLLTLTLLLSGVGLDLTWRLLLGAGAIPALATFYLRRQLAESARFALARGNTAEIALAGFALTFLLPEPERKSLEAIEREGEEEDIPSERIASSNFCLCFCNGHRLLLALSRAGERQFSLCRIYPPPLRGMGIETVEKADVS